MPTKKKKKATEKQATEKEVPEKKLTGREQYRLQMQELAADAFKDHILKPADGHWICTRPDSFFYSFRIAELPGLIAVWGDIQTFTITQGRGYDLAWLRGAVNSMGYVLEKSGFKRDSFIDELWTAYQKENPEAENFDDGYEGYLEFVQGACDDAEHAYESTHDWPPAALWGYWACHTFCRLVEAKEKADVEAEEAKRIARDEDPTQR